MIETSPVREIEIHRPHVALQSRMLLAASDLPKNINVINPAKSVTSFTKEQLTDFERHDYSLFDHASTNERKKMAGVKREELDQKVTEWATSCANLVKGDVRGKKFFGDGYQSITTENMVTFYNTYFTGRDKQSDLKLFVKDIIDRYTSEGKIRTEDLLKDLPDIQWFAHVFGSNSSEIVTQLIDAEMMLQTNPDTLVKIGNQNINGFTQGSDDERLLTFLWDNRTAPQTSPEPPQPTPPKPPTPRPSAPATEPPQPLEINRTYTLPDIFRMVSDPVPTDHEFYMKNPPDGITLTPQQMEQLKTKEPFFIAWKHAWAANPKVIPWDKFTDDPRFNHAEDLTQRDSGTVALAAVSAPDAEKQATLYKTMAKTILSFHEQNPRFLEEWMNAQQNEISNLDPVIKQQFTSGGFINASPASVFANFDISGLTENRDHNQLLVPLGPQHKVETTMLPAMWNPRIQELKKLFDQPNPQLQPHHLRWIEFLSHSVDMSKLVGMIKSQQPTVPESAKGNEITGKQIYGTYVDAIQKHEKAKAVLDLVTKTLENKYKGKIKYNIFDNPDYEKVAKPEIDAIKVLNIAEAQVATVEDKLIPQIFKTTVDEIYNKRVLSNDMDVHYHYIDLRIAVTDFVVANIRNQQVPEAAMKVETALTTFNATMKKVDPGFKAMGVEEFLLAHNKLLDEFSQSPQS